MQQRNDTARTPKTAEPAVAARAPEGPDEHACSVAPDRSVELHLEFALPDGSVGLSTFGEEPIVCRIGDGTLTPAFESCIQGLGTGSDTRLVASGSDLFGHYDASNRHWMNAGEFPPELDPVPGQLICFSTPAGHAVSGLVLALEDARVQVDFNHPFSGHDLSIRVQVLAVGP